MTRLALLIGLLALSTPLAADEPDATGPNGGTWTWTWDPDSQTYTATRTVIGPDGATATVERVCDVFVVAHCESGRVTTFDNGAVVTRETRGIVNREHANGVVTFTGEEGRSETRRFHRHR